MSQLDCLNSTRPKKGEQRLVCAIQYSPSAKEIETAIKKHWHIIETDSALKHCLKNPPQMVYKRPPNLRNMLVRADLPPPTPTHFLSTVPSGNYPCGRCQQCHFTHKTKFFNHPHTGKKYDVKGIIS